MEVTEVRIQIPKTHKKHLRAFATMTFDDCFVVRDIRIIEGKNGLWVAMPNKKLRNGELQDIAHPIKTETRRYIDDMIIQEYKKVFEEHKSSEKLEETPENISNTGSFDENISTESTEEKPAENKIDL